MEANLPEATPTIQEQAKSPEDSLAQAKAKFRELLDKQRGKAPEPAKPAEPAAEAEPAATPEPKEEAAPPAKAKSPEVEKLRNKLLLAGNPKRAVESLDDDEVAEWWKRQEERERTASLALQRASDLEKQLASKATSQEPEEPQGVPTSEALDLDEIADSLTDQFGEDEAKVLTATLKGLIEPLRKENDQIKAIIAEAQKQGRAQLEQRNRDRLSKDLPALKENSMAWNAVQREVSERVAREPQRYASPEEAYDDVFKGIYGDILSAQKPTTPVADDGKAKARIAASGLTPPSSQRTPKARTPAEAGRAAFDHLLKNPGDKDGARSVFQRLTA